jgi:hypothetical protein
MMYYNLKRLPDGWRMVKFDNLFNVEAVYKIRFSRGKFYCDCPATGRPSCRHRDMVPTFIDAKAVDTGRFLCYDTGEWHPPVEGLSTIDILPPFPRPRKLSIAERKHSTRAGRHRQ